MLMGCDAFGIKNHKKKKRKKKGKWEGERRDGTETWHFEGPEPPKISLKSFFIPSHWIEFSLYTFKKLPETEK